MNTNFEITIDKAPDVLNRVKEYSTKPGQNEILGPIFIWVLCFAEALAISNLINNDRKTGIRKVLMMMGLQVNYRSSSNKTISSDRNTYYYYYYFLQSGPYWLHIIIFQMVWGLIFSFVVTCK